MSSFGYPRPTNTISDSDFLIAAITDFSLSGVKYPPWRPTILISGKDFFILENGGLIFNNNLKINQEWYDQLEPERKYLTDIQKQMSSDGWILDDKGRTSMIRIRKKDNPHKSLIEFENLCQNIELPDELKKTINLEKNS